MKKLEQLGTGLSVACAIHCLLTPVAVAALPLLGHQLSDSHWVEVLVIGAAAAIGYLTLGLSFRRHGRLQPLLVLTLGLLLLVLGHTVLPHDATTAISVVGALTLAGAQLLNRRCATSCCSGH